MKRKRLLGDAQQVEALAKLILSSRDAQAHESDQEQSWALAHALADLEEAFSVCLEDYLPQLMNSKPGSPETNDLLLDIGEELRQILYHVEGSKFYGYLLPPPIEA